MKRPSNKTILIAAGALVVVGFAVRPAHATTTGLPSTGTARSELNGLTVASRTHAGTYRSTLFPTWDIVSGTCDTRESVIKQDGHDVKTNTQCTALSGSWHTTYDGGVWDKVSSVTVDEMVPLKNAWESGAWDWTSDKRERFANDMKNPQLTTINVDLAKLKGSKSPDAWKPPLTTDYCDYAKAWVQVKSFYTLTVTTAEKAALTSMLNSC
jgi:hypothetical protein